MAVQVQLSRRRFTVDEYHRIAEAGVLLEDDRVELIEGEIIEMAPLGNPHNACVDTLNTLLHSRVGNRAIVRTMGSVRLSENTEPQPDIALLRPRADFYRSIAAGPADILLLVEVADTSLPYDRDLKLPLYARSGIPDAWLVDLEGETVLVCRDPAPEGYRDVQSLKRGESLSPAALPAVDLTVDEVLG